MEFLKMKKFRKATQKKPNPEKHTDNSPVSVAEQPKKENGEDEMGKSVDVDNNNNGTEADEDDDDFIMNEVKRRLKELRRNSFMKHVQKRKRREVEEEEGEASSNEWRDVEAEGRQLWSCFGAFYDKYCERMLSFDHLTTQLLKEIGSHNNPSTPSPRSVSKKLTSPLRCLSLKKMEHPEDDNDNDAQQLQQPEHDPYVDLETAYVSQLCLTWEALHCQYSQLITCQSETSKCYNQSAQQFQQFQVLLQRFIENEPFERGLRPEFMLTPELRFPNSCRRGIRYAGAGSRSYENNRELDSYFPTFRKMDKKKSNGVRNLFGGQNQMATPLQQVQSLLDKRKVKLKELWKKRKGGKKNHQWPATQEEVELLLGLIDVKVISRVLRMVKISKEHLFWSEEKMKKLDISTTTGKLQRDPSPILFPC
ncbi:hypothetical protein OSB04_004760 [Centaurea solstitialis]|uniref:Uncharacterized protein n=1 Tax=Centaurea solstitialis TaxID=347529 RepID=A0AA38TRC6_9ASTR|nr:hypothetical protein OSB04_004760 [Centaurea solstitialis]